MRVRTLLRIISGARYSGVPHSVQVRPFTRLAKPKSVTFWTDVKTGSVHTSLNTKNLLHSTKPDQSEAVGFISYLVSTQHLYIVHRLLSLRS